MGLIKVIEYGDSNNILTLKVAIPKDSYFSKFYACTQDEITSDNYIKNNNYIEGAKAPNDSIEDAFNKMFTYITDYVSDEDGNLYSIYELKNSFVWTLGKDSGVGIKISKEDLLFVTMQLEASSVGKQYIKSSECGCDNTIHTVVLYDDLQIKLDILSYAKFIECSCAVPEEFMDKVLQLKAFELSIYTKNYYKAAQYWIKFYKNKNKVVTKRCGCNG